MSSTALRFHPFTVSFLPLRRERQMHHLVQSMRLRVSRRRLKGMIRQAFQAALLRAH